ncbi:prolyl-tRNA synthetase [Bacillaceae bacterium JMAK1]|nr:prolyl-tRNA synthetase [Bacillaceae bacterium JMAK1]
MRQQLFFSPTMRDVPSDAEAISHQLMLRAGLMRQTASGIYSYLPLGLRMIQKIQTIIREEMNASGAQELLMPAIQPSELWEESGRLGDYGPELMRLNDRHDREFVLGPTHEEVITTLVRDGIASYKRLPVNLYQIQTKYRDERRPRFGLLRGREFIMKDAYSFSVSDDELNETYESMYKTYERIFKRCGLDFRAVKADGGAISGSAGETHEFQALAAIGEDTIAYSDASTFAANIEIAATAAPTEEAVGVEQDLKEISADNLAAAVSGNSIELRNTLCFVDEKPVLVVTKAEDTVSDVKLSGHFKTLAVQEASSKEVEALFGVEQAYVGPLHADEGLTVVVDHGLTHVKNATTGANAQGQYFTNVSISRDLADADLIDLRMIKEGDASPDGVGTIQFAQGIEVGQVFKLGTKYSEVLKAEVLDENGRSQALKMGCYGIGVSRTLAAIIEQHHDENGIVWPNEVTPFDLHLLVLNAKAEEQVELSEKLYETLQQDGYDVLYDDRKERAGVKFKDSDLFGLPLRIAVGKRASEGIVEVKERKTGVVHEVHVDELAAFLKR